MHACEAHTNRKACLRVHREKWGGGGRMTEEGRETGRECHGG